MYTTKKLIEDFSVEMPKSELHKDQMKVVKKDVIHDGEKARLVIEIRYGDDLGNGHNTFSITGSVYVDGDYVYGGAIHEKIAAWAPELRKYLKWHLVSTDGPLYYVENSRFHLENGNLDYARSTAVWPDASADDILSNDKMAKHLEEIMPEFKRDIEELGFTY